MSSRQRQVRNSNAEKFTSSPTASQNGLVVRMIDQTSLRLLLWRKNQMKTIVRTPTTGIWRMRFKPA